MKLYQAGNYAMHVKILSIKKLLYRKKLEGSQRSYLTMPVISLARFDSMTMTQVYYIGLIICLFNLEVQAEVMNMKIVDEPSSYGLNNAVGNYYQQLTETLKMKVKPANFSGPSHLERLKGKCFSKVLDSYRYELCPFANVTQYEQSLRWNPYNGVLGVWKEWEIRNNTFVAMVMDNGDNCDDKNRLVKVFFSCGSKSEILNATEPFTCEYHLKFQTVLACPQDAMLVYPTLSENYREEWNELETRLFNEEITLKGYDKKLHSLFEKAGLFLSEEKKKLLSHEKQKDDKQSNENETTSDNNNKFKSLDKCSKEYDKLENENERLRSILSDHGIDDKHPVESNGAYINISEIVNATSVKSGNITTNITSDN